MAYGTPGVHTHEQWLGLVQPVGLVVAPAVLSKLELFPNQGTAYLSARQRQLEALLEERETPKGEPIQVVPGFAPLATDLLDWGEADLLSADQLRAKTGGAVPEVVLAEYGETLRPTHGVPKFEGEGLQALVLDLTEQGAWGLPFDEPWNPTGHGWDATPQQRFERLLKETEHPIGILFNGSELRLLHAPRGESSGWLTMPLEPMAEVAGRPMLGALELLLGVDRLFGGNPEQRLPALLVASRKNQNEVSTRLAEQVLEALWELLLGFDAAERVARDAGGTVLGELPTNEAGQKHLYGGLITVLLRLVFLLYAEDEALMPKDSLYGQHYSVSALADRLRQERFEHQGAMVDRRGAWASLLSLFRLVYDGGGADPAYLPARHGELFDPDAYPFLEGREPGSDYSDGILDNLPAVSDDVVEKVLSRLLWLADASKVAQRLSYRSLDVEQIGSVYEGIMGFTVEGATGPSVGIMYRPPRQKITITVVVDADQLLAQGGSKREKWLDEQAGVALKLPAKVKSELKSATTLAELYVALDKKLSPHTPNGLVSGSLILQPTAERRRSGSHYTPRALTEPIVAEAFRPWLERCNHKPTAEQVLALKVCDPAMGSGAFLVAVCRFLAGWLVEAWERDGYPDDFREEWDKDIVARRRIAQSCLYGVDKNPFAVNLAKLSLWLVTLSKELPFTFVDHALKCGDSLVGYSVKEIRAAMSEVQLGFLDAQNHIYEQMGIDRRESFAFDSLSDADYDSKKLRLDEQIKATEGLRQAGDLMVAAFFAKTKPKERADKQQVYLAMLSGAFNDEGLQDSIQEICDRLAAGEKGITPFHWDLEFPEVLGDGREGFDAIIGNPPFIGGSKIYGYLGKGYPDWLRNKHKETEGKGVDIVVHFFRAAETLLSTEGAFSLIAQSSLCEGDSRKAGLCHLIQNGWTIFSATSRLKWPGAANVVICLTAPSRAPVQNATWNKKTVCNINSHLMPVNTEMNPSPLVSMSDTCFVGYNLYGEGFLFSDQIPAGESGSMAEALELIAREPNLNEVIKPYIGGQEISNSPTQSGYRMAINFRDMTKNEAMQYQEAFRIVEERVKPERDRISGDYSVAESRKQNWWLYGTYTPALYNAIEQLDHVAAASYTSFFFAPSILSSSLIFNKKVVAFAFDETDPRFSVLSSTIHQSWVIQFGTTQGTGVTYSPRTCYQTFPMPPFSPDEKVQSAMSTALEMLAKRTDAMRLLGIGLTAFLGKVSSPYSMDKEIIEYRKLQVRLDRLVASLYGWDDIDMRHGFYLDAKSLDDLGENDQASEEDGDLYTLFIDMSLPESSFINVFDGSAGIGLPWRFGMNEGIRIDMISRLLELNTMQSSQSRKKIADKTAGGGGSPGGSGTGRRRGRPPKTPPPDSGQTAQIGLAL